MARITPNRTIIEAIDQVMIAETEAETERALSLLTPSQRSLLSIIMVERINLKTDDEE